MPLHMKVIEVKSIYKIKTNLGGSVWEYKARLIVEGYSQQFDIDYDETLALVSRHDTIGALLAVAA